MPRRKTSEEEILAVALEVFAEKGFHAASVTDIHERAGVGRGTFYGYFTSKEEVFERALERALAPVRRVLSLPPELLAEVVPRNLKARSFDVLAVVLELALANRAAAQLFLREAFVAGPRFAQQTDAFFRDAIAYLERLFVILVERGWFAPVDTHTFAVSVVGILKETILQELVQPSGRPPIAILRALGTILLDGAAGPRLRD